MSRLADIRDYALGTKTPVTGYDVSGVSGETGLKTAYVKFTDAVSDVTYFAFSIEALQLIANDPAVPNSDNTNIHLYNPTTLAIPPEYFSKQTAGVLQTEVALKVGKDTDVVQYLSFNVPPREFTSGIASTSTYQIKYYTDPANLSQVTTYEKFTDQLVFVNPVNGLLIVYNEVDFLRAAVGTKLDASGDLVPIVEAGAVVKYDKGTSVEYYQKAPLDVSGADRATSPAYFRQIFNVNETANPITYDIQTTDIWREYGTPDSIDIEVFATNAFFQVGDKLYSGGLNANQTWGSGVSGEGVRLFEKTFAQTLKEDLGENGVYHYVYDNAAFKEAVITNAVAEDNYIIDLRAGLSTTDAISTGGISTERKKPSTTHTEKFQMHSESKVLKRVVGDKTVYYNYGTNLTEMEFATEPQYSDANGDHLYIMSLADVELMDVSGSGAFSKSAHGLLRDLKTANTLGTALTTYRAYTQTGLKSAASELVAANRVTEQAQAGMDSGKVWTKYNGSLAALKDASDNYLTFYSINGTPADLSGAVSFPLTRKVFATEAPYTATNTLIQRIVENDAEKTDIESVKIGANVVNKVGDDSNSYAYTDVGLATAARSDISKTTVKLVTAKEYHQDDSEVVDYTKEKEYVLRGGAFAPYTYNEYSDLSGALGLDIKTFATTAGYAVGSILSYRNITSGVEKDAYVKLFAGLVADKNDVQFGEEASGTLFPLNTKTDTIFYSYENIAGIMNAAPSTALPIGMTVVEASGPNEPSRSDLIHHSYYKKAVGLAEKTNDATKQYSYSHIGMYNFALDASNNTSSTVIEDATGFRVEKTGSATWTWQSLNILKSGISPFTYVTFTNASASALTERTFATSSTYIIDASGAVLKRRTLSDSPNVDSSATTLESTETIRKISHDLVLSSADAAFHAYGDIGRLNAAIDTADLANNNEVKDLSGTETVYIYVKQYVLQKKDTNLYYEYSGLTGDINTGGATPVSTLATLTLRDVATDDSKYPLLTELKQMRQNGTVEETFVKKYSNIMLEQGGQYYAYTTASLATIANAQDLAVDINDLSGTPTEVWDISGANFPTNAEVATLYKKIESWILRSGPVAGSYTYRSYVPADKTLGGIPLLEFACKDVSANGIREFSTGDKLIDVSNNITYERIARSVLKNSADDVSGSIPVFYVYSGFGIADHLNLKEAAIAAVGVVPLDSILKTDKNKVWIKNAINLVSSISELDGSTFYRTFKDVTGDAAQGIVGASAFATDSKYAIGSALRTVEDIGALAGSRFLKVLEGVLYHFETDYYDVYSGGSINGLKNAAQAEDLSENRVDSNLYNVRPNLNKIEVGAIVQDVSNNAYYQRIERNVLFAIDISGVASADGKDTFNASNPPHYYDYDPSGHFGTFTLEELATQSAFTVGTLLTDMISEDGTFRKEAADVILRSATSEYYTYSSDISGTEWVAKNGNLDTYVMEKFSPVSDVSRNYLIADRNVLAQVDISGDASSAGNTYKVPATTTFFAYNLASDVSGIRLVSFAWKVESPIRAFADGDVLCDRTSQRLGTLYTISASQLLSRDDGATVDYLAYGQDGLANFAALEDIAQDTEVTEQDGLTDAWKDAVDVSGSADGLKSIRTGAYLTYKYESLNVLRIGDNTEYYVYRLDSDVSGLTLNTFATNSSYPKNDTFTNRDITRSVDGTVEGKLYDGPVYTKVLTDSHGVLSRKADRSKLADAELRTYDASGSVLGLRNAALAAFSDISDGVILIPENDCPLADRPVNMASSAHRYLRCSKGLLRETSRHDVSGAYVYLANFLAFQGASEVMPYAALKQAAKNIDSLAVATSGDRLVAAESKIYVTADGALTAYNLATIDYTKDNATNFPDTLRVGDFADLSGCNKITFADASARLGQTQADLRLVMSNFSEFDAAGSTGNLSSGIAGLYASKTIQNYTDGSSSLPLGIYKVVRRGLMSVGTDASGNLEYYTFSDKGLVAAAVAAEKNSDGKFSFVKADGTVEHFRRVAKGLLVSTSRLNNATGESTAPTAAIMYFADYDSTADDDKANMYFYLYSLATKRGVGIDLSGSATTGDSERYKRDANGALYLDASGVGASDNIIDFIKAGTITTLYSIVSLVGDASGNDMYGAERYEIISYPVTDASDVEVPNTIKVTPISSSGAMITDDKMTGIHESFYVAYDPLGMDMTSSAAVLALASIANTPITVIPRDAYIYLGDKYTIDISKKYVKYDEGSITDPNGQTLTYSLKGLRAFAHKYSDVTGDRSVTLAIGVSGEALDVSGTYTQYLNYVYYWFEKGVVLTYNLSNSPALADAEFSMKPSRLAISGTKQRFDIFHKNTDMEDEASAHTFVKRALLADISGSTQEYADFNKGAFKAGAKFVIHNDNNTEAYPEDIVLFKLDSGLVAKKIGSSANTDSSGYEFYAFNDYALAAGSNSNIVNGELLRRMENEDISVPYTNNWRWQTTGLLEDVSGADSGQVWRLYTNGDRDHGRQAFALNSTLNDTLDYFTYSYPNTTTLVYKYNNVLNGSIPNHDAGKSQSVSVMRSDVSGYQDPATSAAPARYLTYGNAGLALLANSSDLSGVTQFKITPYSVLPISSQLSDLSDNTSGTYYKLQQGTMYSGTHMVLYDESKFEEIMDREDIAEFATMDANNSYASTVTRATLRPVPLERVFVPDASGQNQGSAKIFDASNVVHGSTTYLVEKVLERDLLGSYAGASEYIWTTNVLSLGNEQTINGITTQVLEVTNKNGNKQTYRNRTWLRPTDIDG